MKQAFIILFLLFNITPSFSQEERSQWIIIDTIIVPDNFSIKERIVSCDEFLFSFTYTRYNKSGESFAHSTNNDIRQINPKTRFYESGSSETIEIYLTNKAKIKSFNIKLDDKGSAIAFENLPDTDTFHIPKWTLYHNCLQDTIHHSTAYFNYNNGKIVNEYKHKVRDVISPTDCNDTLKNYQFIFNGIRYVVPLNIYEREILTYYHGSPNKRNMRKNERNRNSKHKRFAGMEKGITRQYEGELDLTN